MALIPHDGGHAIHMIIMRRLHTFLQSDISADGPKRTTKEHLTETLLPFYTILPWLSAISSQ